MGANVNQKQIGGTHYQKLDPAPWDVILKWNLGYLEGTALKYIARWRDKGGLDDIRKAIHFLEKLLETETGKSLDPRIVDKTVQVPEKSPFPFPPVEKEKDGQKRTTGKAKKA